MPPDLSVIIPVYNEENNIESLIQSLEKELKLLKKRYEIIFVDDGSEDNTSEILKKFQNKIKIITFDTNRGLSGALNEGFRFAKGDMIITLDGDLQNDTSDISRLIKELNNYDVVCGWRYNRKDSFIKKCLPSKIFNFVISLFFNLNIHDVGCTFRSYKKDVVKTLRLENGDHRILPVLLLEKGFKIGELKVKHNPRMKGEAKYNSPLRFIQAFKTIIRIIIQKGF